MKKRYMIGLVCLVSLLTVQLGAQAAGAGTEATRYNLVLAGTETADGFTTAGTEAQVRSLVTAAGGTIVTDLSKEIGFLTAVSANPSFASTVSASSLVTSAGQDFSWKAFGTKDELLASGQLVLCAPPLPDPTGSCPPVPAPFPGQTADPLEALQWDMQNIQAPEAHNTQTGNAQVEVGILDSGVDATHVDFMKNGVSNVDCVKARDFTLVGTKLPCADNQFHGTHVAGTVAARANGLGMVGVAPDVTLVPVKVCDASGYCYAGPVVEGITYAGTAKLEAINMSFFVDDDELLTSTEFKCSNDPAQRTIRHAVERAIQFARNQGVTPVAALGNSDEDLAHPEAGNECEVVPAETQGVIGTMALGLNNEKARYSNYGTFATDVAAPGGNGSTGDCRTTILSTFPGNAYGCIQGTSMASPHAAGVVALIISQFGQLGSDGDWKLAPTKVEAYLQGTTVDQGLSGYDECFGHGRINALKAVQHDTKRVYDPVAPFCAEYSQ